LSTQLDEDTIRPVEPLVSHHDVTTIMGILADIKLDVRRIRIALEEEDGEEEEADREPDC
jgi:hypothetical protein